MPYRAHFTASEMVMARTAALPIAAGTTNADSVHTPVVKLDSTQPGSPSVIHLGGELPAERVSFSSAQQVAGRAAHRGELLADE